MINKRKIFNDPIYGFITIPYEIILDLIDHPYLQRLRRIKQLGLTHLVYPGALHTRFHHVTGAMHLMTKAIKTLREKGVEITEEEAKGVTIAILLHDVGHGPYSHTLEHSIVEGISHEDISSIVMQKLNNEFNGDLTCAIEIFNNTYPKKFLHQLVSSQLDMDRLDYLKRDSFYSGVSEGVISSDRIIDMLVVNNDELAIEQKGIYSIEKFIVARRLMYWQVYLHKTVLSAEFMLMNILKRAKELTENGEKIWDSPNLEKFLKNRYHKEDFLSGNEVLETFLQLDDYDIFGAVKIWATDKDPVLSELCSRIVNRDLFKVKSQKVPFTADDINKIKKIIKTEKGLSETEAAYFIINESITNNAYNPKSDRINIQFKNGEIKDITEASDNFNISALSVPVEKYFLCTPKYLASN